MVAKKGISETDIDSEPDKQSAHVEKLLNSQAKLLNVQAEATQSFGKAIGNLNTATEELIEQVSVLPTQEDLITGLGNPIVSEINSLSEQISAVEAKLDERSEQNTLSPTLTEDISNALILIKENLQHSSEFDQEFASEKMTSVLENFQDDFIDLLETAEQKTGNKLDAIVGSLKFLEKEIAELKSKGEEEKGKNLKGLHLDELSEFDLGKDRLQKVVVGFEILMRGLGKDVREFRKATDAVHNIEQKFFEQNHQAEAEKLSLLFTRLTEVDHTVKSLSKLMVESLQQNRSIVQDVLSKDTFDTKSNTEILQKTSVNFSVMVKNFSADMQLLKNLVASLKQNAFRTDSNEKYFAKEEFKQFCRKLDDIQRVIELKQTQDDLDNNVAQLRNVTSQIEQANSDELTVFNPAFEQQSEISAHFQILLEEISGLTSQYKHIVENIHASYPIETVQHRQDYGLDETVDKISQIVASLDNSSLNKTSKSPNAPLLPARNAVTLTAQPHSPVYAKSQDAVSGLYDKDTNYQKMMIGMRSVLSDLSREVQRLQKVNNNLENLDGEAFSSSLHNFQNVLEAKLLDKISETLMSRIGNELIENIEGSIKNKHDMLEAKIMNIIKPLSSSQAKTLPGKTKLRTNGKNRLRKTSSENSTQNIQTLDRVVEHLR